MFDGHDVLTLGAKALRRMRRDLQMIFQDPFESLNARHTVGEILVEPFVIHGIGSRRRAQRTGCGSLLGRGRDVRSGPSTVFPTSFPAASASASALPAPSP